MSPLERDLRALRDTVAWPPTPDVAATVAARIAAAPAPRRRRLSLRARLALAAVVAALAGTLAVSPAGASLLRWIGIGSTIRVSEVQRLPVARDPNATVLGAPVSLERARLLADFPVRVAGRPQRVRFSAAILGGAVTLEYPDAQITQFAGSSTEFLQKLVAPPARARRVRVGGRPGVFISGGPTVLIAADRDGQGVTFGGVKAGTNVLLWEDGAVALRIATRRDLAGALALARRLR